MDLIPHRPVRMAIHSSSAHLPIVRETIGKMCEMLGFDVGARGAIVLGVDEALTNIIKHAYDRDSTQPIEIELTPLIKNNKPEGLKIQLADRGRWTEPDQIKSRDLSDLRPGGLGVHIIKKCMDNVEFAARKGGGTMLTLVKMLQPRSGHI